MTRSPTRLTALEIDAMAGVLREVGKRVGRKLLLVQVSELKGGFSVHFAQRGSTDAFARYAGAVREHVEQVHAIASLPGFFGTAARGLLTTLTSFSRHPSVLHENVDALVEHLRARHDIEPAALRAAIAEVNR